jgi:mannose-1-phosphate guanylyltransferase/phosphomannomutase
VAELPPVHIVHQPVHTPWDQKGMVMRTLVERSPGRDLVLVDGVKIIEDDGWALVLPDPEEPLTHVWAEARTEAEALARAQEYAVRLEQLVR